MGIQPIDVSCSVGPMGRSPTPTYGAGQTAVGGGPSPTLHSANRIFLAARPRTADLSGLSTAHRSAAHHANSSRATATEQVTHRAMPPGCGAALHNAARAAALRVWASASGVLIIADHSSSAMSTEISRSESINTPVHFPFGPRGSTVSGRQTQNSFLGGSIGLAASSMAVLGDQVSSRSASRAA
jgi:hypothetical protein